MLPVNPTASHLTVSGSIYSPPFLFALADLLMLLALMGDCYTGKYQSQASEYESLNKSDKKFQPVERHGHDPRYEESGRQHQYFPCGHVAKETEGEADHPHHVAECLQSADDNVDDTSACRHKTINNL